MSSQLFVGGIGGPELMIVLLLAVLLFGANKLPKLARASGEAMGEFQKGRENLERDIREATSTTPTPDDSVRTEATTDMATDFNSTASDSTDADSTSTDGEFDTHDDDSPEPRPTDAAVEPDSEDDSSSSPA